jgi:hypothetical protein
MIEELCFEQVVSLLFYDQEVKDLNMNYGA